MHANIIDLFGKISSLLTSTGHRRPDATPTGAHCGFISGQKNLLIAC
jgi:hypothetical protein